MASMRVVHTIRKLMRPRGCRAMLALALGLAGVAAAHAQTLLVTIPAFPLTPVGQSATANVTVQINTGGNSVVFNSIALAPGFADYTLGAISGCALDGTTPNTDGTICTATVTFTPKFAGSASAPAPIARTAPLLISDVENGTAKQYAFGLVGGGTQGQPVLTPGIISALIGNDVIPTVGFGGDNGPASAAVFRAPTNLAMDVAGNIYISDTGNCVVRRVDAATHTVTTVAGVAPSPNTNCGAGTDGVAATASMLNSNNGIALDAAGNLYIADTGNHAVRMVSAANGLITTVAGTLGSAGFSGDTQIAITAQLTSPMGVAVDGYGNIFIADTGNFAIRKVSPVTGLITTVAGVGGVQGPGGVAGSNGPATSFHFNNPTAVAVDSAGDIYVADTGGGYLWRVDAPTQTIGFLSATTAPPVSISIDSTDMVYFTQLGDCTVYKATQYSNAFPVAGNGSCVASGDGGSSALAGLNHPMAVVPDGAGNAYVLEADGVRMVTNSATATNAVAFGSTNIGLTVGPIAYTLFDADVPTPSGGAPTAMYLSLGQQLSTPFATVSPTSGQDCTQTFSLVAGGFCTLSMTFSPTADGTFNASTTLTEYSSGQPVTTTFNLTGTGAGSLPTATITPGPLAFTAVVKEAASAPQTVTLTNTSTTTPLTISSIGFLNAGSVNYVPGFTQTNNCGISLAAGASCAIQVSFQTSSSGTFAQQLIVTDNTAAGQQTTLVNGTATAPIATLPTAGIAFGPTSYGTVSASQTMVLTNTGTAPLTIAGIALGGDFPEQFSLDASACPASLGVNASCNIKVAFQPNTPGNFTASVIVTDDSGGQRAGITVQQSQTVSGTSPAPVQNSSFAIANTSFAATPVGTPETQTVQLTLQSANTILKSIVIGPGNTEYSVGAITGCVVNGIAQNSSGAVCAIPVTFSPTLVGYSRSATLVVTTIESGTPTPYYFALTGTSNGTVAALTPGIMYPYLAGYNTGSGGGVGGTGTTATGFGQQAIYANVGYLAGQAIGPHGELYVMDSYYNVIYRIDLATGNLSLYAGRLFTTGGYIQTLSGDGGPATSATIATGGPITADLYGNLFLSDGDNFNHQVVRRIDANTHVITTIIGGGSGCTTATDALNDGCVGTTVQFAGGSLATDNQGNLYISSGAAIQKWDAKTNILSLVAGGPSGAPGTDPNAGGQAIGATINASALVLDQNQNLYFIDGGLKVRKVNAGGNITTVAGITKQLLTNNGFSCQTGTGANYPSGDGGPATMAGFGGLKSIALDAANDIYLVDNASCQVRRIDADTQNITTVAGLGSYQSAEYGNLGDPYLQTDGSAVLAALEAPLFINLDSSANMYITGWLDTRKINVSQSVIDFSRFNGVVEPVGGSTAAMTATVLNAGNAGVLTFNSPFTDPTAFGVSTADFTRDVAAADCIAGTGISPGTECPVNIDFTPTTVGTPLMATDTVADSAATLTQTITLLGSSSPAAGITLMPHLLSFSTVVNVVTAAQNFTLTNNTSAPLPIASVTLIGSGAANFALTNQCPSMLASGASCTIAVTYMPSAAGQSMAQVSVADTPNGTPATQLGGLTGVAGTALAQFIINPTQAGPGAFGSVNVNSASTPHMFTLQSYGTAAVAISGISITGTDAAQFTLGSTTCGASLAPQDTCTITVTFTPLASSTGTPATPFSAMLTVTDNASNAPQQTAMSGIGVGTVSTLSISESVHVTDTVTPSFAAALGINETVHVNDAVLPSFAAALGISETVHISDAVMPSLAAALGITETVHVTDAVVPALAASLGITEIVHIADTPVATVINASSTSTALVSSNAMANVGASIAFTATVTGSGGTPTGTVNFMSGTTTLGVGTLNAQGVAAYTTSTLTAGVYNITAVYTGDLLNTGSTSTVLVQTIVAQDFSITVLPPTLTLKQGATGTAVLTLTPFGGFAQTIQLSCANVPANAICTFSPTALTPNGAAVSSTITVTTSGPTALLRSSTGLSLFAANAGFGCGLLLLLRRRRSNGSPHRTLVAVLVGLIMAGICSSMMGCGGSGNSTPITPLGSSPITVTATTSQGGTTHTVMLTVTVTN